MLIHDIPSALSSNQDMPLTQQPIVIAGGLNKMKIGLMLMDTGLKLRNA